MKRGILAVFGVCAVVLAMGAAGKAHAGTADNIVGWLWGGAQDATGISSGINWVSMNSLNCDINGDGVMNRASGDAGASADCPIDGTTVANYGVSVPLTDGAVTGYAYSKNVGYIDFAPHSDCAKYAGACDAYPVGSGYPTTDVMRTGNNLSGWARIVDIAKAGAAGNSGGNAGWIKMSGTGYGIAIGADGKLGGYAWSNEFGALNFSGLASDGTPYGAQMPGLPSVTLNADPLTINVDNPLPQATHLTWSGSNITSCTASTAPDAALWTGLKATASVGSGDAVTIDSSHLTENFTLTCTGPGGPATSSVSVTTGCNKKACSNEVCASTFMVTGTVDNATCVAQTTCSADSDCAPRSSGTWTEVAP
jgi:hypothetical protein